MEAGGGGWWKQEWNGEIHGWKDSYGRLEVDDGRSEKRMARRKKARGISNRFEPRIGERMDKKKEWSNIECRYSINSRVRKAQI